MPTFKFRTLIIDDDRTMLESLRHKLSGMQARIGNTIVRPEIDIVLVEVNRTGDDNKFSNSTLDAITRISQIEYDYTIADYSFASVEKQTDQWNEGGIRRIEGKGTTNHHLLDLHQLKDAAVLHAAQLGRRHQDYVEGFFDSQKRLLLRSFQHDRADDRLGSFENRKQVTRSVFPNLTKIDSLDSFSLIYGSDSELREDFYRAPSRGREHYRLIAATIVQQMFQTALEHHLAQKIAQFSLLKSSLATSVLVIFVGALSSMVGLFVNPLLESLDEGNWSSVSILSVLTIVTVLVGSTVIALISRYGSDYLFDKKIGT